jgi:archaellum component FlaG (FlaF/FlaG flagellin family)
MATNKSITDLTGVTTFADGAFFTLVTAAGDNAKITGANFTTQLAASVETAIDPVFIEVSGDYTITDDNIIVVVTGAGLATITLKATPNRGDKAIIMRASTANVTVDGNGLNVVGSATQTLSTKYDVVNCYALTTEWLYSA